MPAIADTSPAPLRLERPGVRILQVLSAGGVPAVVEIAGDSMAPTLPRGTRVRIVPLDRTPRVGEVVLLAGVEGWVVHRTLHLGRFEAGDRLFHRGDGARTIGLTATENAVGLVTAVLGPAPTPLGLERLPAPARRSFARARWRCRAYGGLRRRAERLGIDPNAVAWIGGRVLL